MDPNFKVVIGVQTGMLLGGIAVWFGTFSNSSNFSVEKSENIQKQISNLVRHANMPIAIENFNCDSIIQAGMKQTVGNVVASMMSSNLTTIRNRQSFDCIENTCSLSISDCKPRQASECSQRFLTYEIDKQQNVKHSTFSCIDVP